ncbi:MAG: hypothetical protein U1E67_11570 [Hyphomicrobiales bacterium]
MSRLPDWPDRLIAEIARHERLEFSYGVSDCMQLAMDCAEAITGEHPYRKARRYRTKRGAASCLKRHGFRNIIEALAAAYPKIAPSLARRGDIGIIYEGNAPCAVVCEGLFFVGKPPGTVGLVRIPRAHIKGAFAVGWAAAFELQHWI